MNWFAIEMHCHTKHSDGKFTVEELISAAKEYQLDAIALTDHNTTSGWVECDKMNFPVLKGIEWTTYFGHMLVLDCPEYIDWRDASIENIDEKIGQIKKAGGIVGVAHPFEIGSPMCTGCFWEFDVKKWENINYIEAWSKPFPASLVANERAMQMWTNLLDSGYKIAATYGRDWHGSNRNRHPCGCTYIGTEENSLSSKAIKEALKKGRTAVTMGPKLILEAMRGEEKYNIGDEAEPGMLSFRLSVDMNSRKETWDAFNFKAKTFKLITNQNKILYESEFSEKNFEIPLELRKCWVRGELWGTVKQRPCLIAFTSPIYIK